MKPMVDWSRYPEAPFEQIPEARRTYASRVRARRLTLAFAWIVLAPLSLIIFSFSFVVMQGHIHASQRVVAIYFGLFALATPCGLLLQRYYAKEVKENSSNYRATVNAIWRSARFPGGKGFDPTATASDPASQIVSTGAKLSQQRWFQGALSLGILVLVPIIVFAIPATPTRTWWWFLLVFLSFGWGFIFGSNITSALVVLNAPGFKFPAVNDGLVAKELGDDQRKAAYAAVYAARAQSGPNG